MTFQNLFPESFEQVLVVRNHKVGSQWALFCQSVRGLQGACTVLPWVQGVMGRRDLPASAPRRLLARWPSRTQLGRHTHSSAIKYRW